MKVSILPIRAYEVIKNLATTFAWIARGCSENAPQFVKQSTLKRYANPQAIWVETGTYLGTTTHWLSSNFARVVTIEPSEIFCERARRRFYGLDVLVVNGTSEDTLPDLLSEISGHVNFWLDGHFSGGKTFEGVNHCPVSYELVAIANNLFHFEDVAIFIDDVRCFEGAPHFELGYPSLGWLVDWCREHEFVWHIENDIFVALKRTN